MPGSKGPHHSDKWHDCWDDVQNKGHDSSSAAAICTASLQKAGHDVYAGEPGTAYSQRRRAQIAAAMDDSGMIEMNSRCAMCGTQMMAARDAKFGGTYCAECCEAGAMGGTAMAGPPVKEIVPGPKIPRPGHAPKMPRPWMPGGGDNWDSIDAADAAAGASVDEDPSSAALDEPGRDHLPGMMDGDGDKDDVEMDEDEASSYGGTAALDDDDGARGDVAPPADFMPRSNGHSGVPGSKPAGYAHLKDFDKNVGGGVDRDKLPEGDFAGPGKSFPIVTPGDVTDAMQSLGRTKHSKSQVKAGIKRVAEKKGFPVPDSLKAGEKARGAQGKFKTGIDGGTKGHGGHRPKTRMAIAATEVAMSAACSCRECAERLIHHGGTRPVSNLQVPESRHHPPNPLKVRAPKGSAPAPIRAIGAIHPGPAAPAAPAAAPALRD